MGISLEATYGTPVASPTFVLALQDTPKVEVVQNKVRNISALGSSYQANALTNTVKMANVNLNLKINEDILPLLFAQKFDIVSTTVSGETAVYNHVLSYNSGNVGKSYTLWLEDDDRTGQQIAGVKFSNINLISEPNGEIRAELTGLGKYPTTWTASHVVSAMNEFTGRSATFSYGTYTASEAAYPVLSATLNHTFGLSGDESNFVLGSADVAQIFTTEDEFVCEISALMPDLNDRDDYANNVKKKWSLNITDAGRFVAGSVTNINPSIKFSYPVGYVESWTEEGGLSDVLKQTLSLLPVDEPGVADAPLKITVVNATASY